MHNEVVLTNYSLILPHSCFHIVLRVLTFMIKDRLCSYQLQQHQSSENLFQAKQTDVKQVCNNSSSMETSIVNK